MGLFTCPDCKHQVSDVAPACPHCGRPIGRSAVGPSVASGIESCGRALGDGVRSLSSAFLTAFLIPMGCLVWVFLGGLGGCIAMFGGNAHTDSAPRQAAKPARRAAAQRAGNGFWLSKDGGSRHLGVALSTCRVDTVTVLRDAVSYDTGGNPTYRYKVHIDVYNHTGVPTGPRITVRLYGQTAAQKSETAIAYSLDSDLAPGAAKRFTDTMHAPFVATWVELRDAHR